VRRLFVVGLVVFTLSAVAACDNDDDVASTSSVAPTTSDASSVVIDEARCAANREVGTITYLTGFDFAASAGMLDVVVADEMGYFDAVCLDVKVVAGASAENDAALAAGQAQFASIGSVGEVATANAAGAEIVAALQYGHEPIEELLVDAASTVQTLDQFNGATIGIKGGLPPSIRAMLVSGGVDESSLTLIQVGFDPEELFTSDIDALPGYKSNERHRLAAADREFRSFDPADFDVPGSFGVIATSQSFASDHPTVVEDFVRASLYGFEYAVANPDQAVAATLELSDAAFFFTAESESLRWTTESGLAIKARDAGTPLGSIDLDAVEGEINFLVQLGVIDAVDDLKSVANPSFVAAVTDEDGAVIWER